MTRGRACGDKISLNQGRRSVRLAPRASALLGPRLPSLPCITGFGNRHGSLRGCGGNRGCCGCAQLNAWSARGCSITTPSDPNRTRCRTGGIGQGARLVGTVPIRGPLPYISVHIKKAPRVGGKLSDIHRLVKVRTMVPVCIRTRNSRPP